MEADLKSCRKFLFFFVIGFTVVFIYGYFLLYDDSAPEFRAPLPLSYVPPITIITNNGRLGNQMFTFATLFGLSSLNGRTMISFPKNYEVLSKYFNINYNLVNPKTFQESNPWQIGNWLKDVDKNIPEDSNIIKGTVYPTSFTFFHHCRQQITEVFRFNTEFREHAQGVIMRVKQLRPWTQVYVGVHVRRGDYLKKSDGGWLRAFDGREVDGEFFQKAVQHFTSKYSNVTFLAVSDDREWCKKNLSQYGILTTPDSPGAAHDLALLVECNHTIMTYGTYGFWGGYLSGGEVVYFDDFLKPNTSFTKDYFVYDKMYPSDWVGISTTKPGYWESYKNPFYS